MCNLRRLGRLNTLNAFSHRVLTSSSVSCGTTDPCDFAGRSPFQFPGNPDPGGGIGRACPSMPIKYQPSLTGPKMGSSLLRRMRGYASSGHPGHSERAWLSRYPVLTGGGPSGIYRPRFTPCGCRSMANRSTPISGRLAAGLENRNPTLMASISSCRLTGVASS